MDIIESIHKEIWDIATVERFAKTNFLSSCAAPTLEEYISNDGKYNTVYSEFENSREDLYKLKTIMILMTIILCMLISTYFMFFTGHPDRYDGIIAVCYVIMLPCILMFLYCHDKAFG